MTTTELIEKVEELFSKKYFKEIIKLLTEEELQKQNNDDLYAWRAEAHLALGETEQAHVFVNRSIKMDDISEQVYFAMGQTWIRQGEYDRAISFYTESLNSNKGNSQAYFERGLAWYYKKEYDKASIDYSEAIRLNNKLALAYYYRGLVWYYKKEYDKAIIDYSETICLQNFVPAFFNRGLAWYHKKEYDKSIIDYSEAILLDQNYLTAYNNRGLAWFDKKEYDKAITDYSEAIRLNQNYSAAYNNRGLAWFERKEYGKAIIDYSEAILLNPNQPFTYDNRGNAWLEEKHYDRAMPDYYEAIKLDSNFARPHFSLHRLYYYVDNISLSFSYLNRATYLKYENPISLAEAYHNNFFVPFMLKRVLNKVATKNEFHSLLETYSENDRYCFNWEAVLIIAEKENSKKDFELSLLRLKALINYFMGDCIESYRIYDEDIDANNSYKLNLQDLYYYIRSAQDFLEDYNSNLKIALEQAKEYAGKSKEDAYYAGKLFLLSGKISEAEIYFKQSAADGYRPGLYQLIGLYDSKHFYNREKRDKLLLVLDQLDDKEVKEIYLINGVEPLVLTNGANIVEACYNFCKHYAMYEENIEEIQLVRNLLNIISPFKQNEFWKLIKFEDDEFYRRKIENFELLDFEQLLFKAFDEYCKTTGIENFRFIISRSNQASETEQSIDADILKNKNITYETALAKKISDMKRIGVFAKWFLVLSKLYYLEEKMTIKDAICLHMFAQQTAIRNRDQLNSENIHVEIQVWVRKIITLSSPLITKMLYRAFQFIQDGFVFESPVDDNIIEYENFKKQYNHHLAFWKNSLSVEFMKEKISH